MDIGTLPLWSHVRPHEEYPGGILGAVEIQVQHRDDHTRRRQLDDQPAPLEFLGPVKYARNVIRTSRFTPFFAGGISFPARNIAAPHGTSFDPRGQTNEIYRKKPHDGSCCRHGSDPTFVRTKRGIFLYHISFYEINPTRTIPVGALYARILSISRMMDRSNSAKTPHIWNMAFPAGVVVSMPC